MKIEIKLPISKNPTTGQIYHISERIPKSIDLACPFCGGAVMSRKGQINRHHFAHKDSECSVSKETLLHEGAKYYIFNCLKKEKDFEISVPTELVKDYFTKLLLSGYGVKEITFPISSFIDLEHKIHDVESKQDKFTLDVASFNREYTTIDFAWEIYVTHFSEEDKINFFKKNKIPWLEIEPFEDNKGEYIFKLRNYGGINIFDRKNEILSEIFTDNKRELIEIIKEGADRSFFKGIFEKEIKERSIEIAKKARKELLKEVRESLWDFDTSLALEFAPFYTMHFTRGDEYFDYTAPSLGARWIPLESVESIRPKNYMIVAFNEKYTIERLYYFLGGIYEKLIKNNYCRFIQNRNSEIIGLRIKIPDIRIGSYHTKDIIIDSHSASKKDLDLEYITGHRDNGKPQMIGVGCSGEEYRFISPHQQLMKLMSWFKSKYRVHFIPDRDNHIKAVRVIGIPREYELKEKVRALLPYD